MTLRSGTTLAKIQFTLFWRNADANDRPGAKFLICNCSTSAGRNTATVTNRRYSNRPARSAIQCEKLAMFVTNSAPKLANVICGEATMSMMLSISRFIR
jgi:hypothetical protein